MKIKALTSFAGSLTMGKGQVMECDDEVVLQDLLKAGYIERVDEPKEPEEPQENEEPPAKKSGRKKK